ncbi:MAG: hypothetical protein R2733_13825 [Acidimicrobiales bacterium]
MSIRRTIESLLQDEQQQEAFRASPESFFADHGIEDIPGELIGTAFVHYSDTAPIEHGDAVAGIATHYSAVPFEPDDLPDLGFGESDGTAPFATLGLVSGDELPELPDLAEDEMTADELSEVEMADEIVEDEIVEDVTVDDDIDSASYHDHEFDDGFDEAEALMHDDDAGFGDGSADHAGPTEILGEIHGGGTRDPQMDDPFFEDVTDDGVPTMHLEFESIDFEHHDLQHDLSHDVDHEVAHDALTEHHVDAFDDVDPSDLDLDDF